MTRSFTKWSSLALALASTGAGAANPPNYDVSWEGTSLNEMPRATIQQGARLQGLKAPTLDVAHRDAQGAPTFVWGKAKEQLGAARLSKLQGLKPEQAAGEQLADYMSLYGHTSLASAGVSMRSVSQDASGAAVVTFAQQVDGVEVFRQELKVLLDASNTVVAISGSLSPVSPSALTAFKAAALRPKWSAAQAIARAYTDLTGASLDSSLLQRTSAERDDEYSHFELVTYARPLVEQLRIAPRARSVLFPVSGGLVPAYYLELNTGKDNRKSSDYYGYVVSAADGQVLMRNNLTADASFSYRVWAETQSPYIPLDGPAGGTVTPHPTGTPGTVPTPPYVAQELISLQNAPFSRNDPWLPADATQTLGNNVDAYADRKAPDGYNAGDDLRASVTAPGVFDRTMDFTLATNANAEQTQAATTQLFYVNNWLHDWFYDSGFGEADRNAQKNNYSRGGAANDPILAEAQDYDGTDNANMATPADGNSPRMQMYLFTPPLPTDVNKLNVEVTAPANITGKYKAGFASFGPQVFDVPPTEVVIASSPNASGAGANDTLGCKPLINAADVAGKIVLIDRGTCPFVDKATNAQAAGAVGLIIVNNQPGLNAVPVTDEKLTIPTLTLSQADGQKLRVAVPGLTVKMHHDVVPSLDGTIDNGIVAHEWGHYISNRLVSNAAGLNNNQGRSMGEGWADFHALLMITRAEDINVAANANWNGAYAAAEYATRGAGITSPDSTFFGIRRVTYSADLSKNALTFKHIANGEPLPTTAPIKSLSSVNNSEVHNSGEIWATMLWDCYVSLLRAYPFLDAQARMKQYLVNGYKLTPPSPTYLEARDALIAAATAGSAEDGARFWKAFARRGAGGGATAPPRSSTTHVGVLESYDFLSLTAYSFEQPKTDGLACDADDILDNGETAILRLTVKNVGPETSEATELRVTANSTHMTFTNNGRVAVPALRPGAAVEVTLRTTPQNATTREMVTLSVATRDNNGHPDNVKLQLNLVLNYDETPNSSATETLETSQIPWIPSQSGAAGLVNWGVLNFPAAGNRVFYGQNSAVAGNTYLTTPALNVGSTDFVLTFKHGWSFETCLNPSDGKTYNCDGAVIELSADDGATWADVGTPLYTGTIAPAAITDNPLSGRPALVAASPDFTPLGASSLKTATLNLGTAYANKTVRLRFRIGTDTGTGSTGWLMDDLAFTGITNTPFTSFTAEDSVCVTTSPPTVNAGPDFNVDERTTATLRGSVTAPDGELTSAEWKQLSGPAVTLRNPLTTTATFVAPEVTQNTQLVFQLTGTRGSASASDTVIVTVVNVNRPPTANAGVAGQVNERATYTLMGSATDPDGDTLTYSWAQASGTAVTLRNSTTLQPSFTAPEVLVDETIPFVLTVSDGKAAVRATVNVTVRNVNRAPTANAGDAFSVNAREPAKLDGTRSSDPDGDVLTYAWTQVSGPAVTLSSATSSTPTFTAPSVNESTELRFQLEVKDSALTSAPATVTVTVKPVNRAPTANAGMTGAVDERASYTLMGSASDEDGDVLSYTWVQKAGTPAALRNATTLQASFTAPDVSADETLTFELAVSDGKSTTRATVDVLVRNANRAPTASAGDAFSVNAEAPAQLNGGRSTDADGDTLTYAWTQVSGPTVTLSGATTATATFTAPSVEEQTELVFQLVVKDASLSSAPATVTVTVIPKPVIPTPEPPKGGCSTTGGGAPLGLLGLSLLALARRRRMLN